MLWIAFIWLKYEEHHDGHHVQAHGLHHLGIGVIACGGLGLHDLGIEEHGDGHQEGKERNVVHAQDAGTPGDDVVIGAQVFGPEERLLTQFDGSIQKMMDLGIVS